MAERIEFIEQFFHEMVLCFYFKETILLYLSYVRYCAECWARDIFDSFEWLDKKIELPSPRPLANTRPTRGVSLWTIPKQEIKPRLSKWERDILTNRTLTYSYATILLLG